MKILYQRKYIEFIIQENPLVFISNCEKSILDNLEDIKFKRFKNLILQNYNKNIFNGITYLIYGKNIYNIIKKSKINISGIFLLNKYNKIYIISFNKLKNIMLYNNIFKYKCFFDVLNGNFF